MDKQGKRMECFLKFIAIHGNHESIKIELKCCREKSIDYASNMPGKFYGL